jgi:hypothetical protein
MREMEDDLFFTEGRGQSDQELAHATPPLNGSVDLHFSKRMRRTTPKMGKHALSEAQRLIEQHPVLSDMSSA